MSAATALDDELSRRLAGPQRHRLLQGYPMLPLMRPAVAAERGGFMERRVDGELGPLPFPHLQGKMAEHRAASEPAWIELDASRPLLVGVLPHSQCNPRVEGCGFCTFPHDRFDKQLLRLSAGTVVDDGHHATINTTGNPLLATAGTGDVLAGMIGASREMVNRTLRDLMDQGYISIGRKSITILNDKLPDGV